MTFLCTTQPQSLAVKRNFPNAWWCVEGAVTEVGQNYIDTTLNDVTIGDACTLPLRGTSVHGEVISCSLSSARVALFDPPTCVPGDVIISARRPVEVHIRGASCHGAHLNCFGVVQQPLEVRPELSSSQSSNDLVITPRVIRERTLVPVREKYKTGVPLIDSVCTIGKGVKCGIFAEAGTGKSSLIEMLIQNTTASHTILCLVGERGREVAEWRENLKRLSCPENITLISSTSDETALRKTLSLDLALSLSDSMREGGKDVLLIVDSLTRVARAYRDIGLSRHEPLLTGGITPSVLSVLPQIIERVGATSYGTVTAFFTVLATTEGPFLDPLAEEIKSLLDAHLYLSPSLASEGIYPPLNIQRSLSRIMKQITTPKEFSNALALRKKAHQLLEFESHAQIENPSEQARAHYIATKNSLYGSSNLV
jgi:FliI/YscN family ATPase